MDQLRRAIWQRHQSRKRGHQVTPRSLTLSRFPLLFSSPILFSFYDLLFRSFLSRWWTPWSPTRFSMGELLYSSRWCILFWVFHTLCNHFRFLFLVSFVPLCLLCTTTVVLVVPPPPLWRSYITRPCTSGAFVEVLPPSRAILEVKHLGFFNPDT